MIQEKLLRPDSTQKTKKVLCIDDEVDNLDAVERILRKKYQILKATSGQKALEILQQNLGQIAVIVTDQRMPEMTGVEFLQKSIASHPEASKILLTGYTDLESVITAVNDGQIQRYLTKPWDPTDLSLAVDQAYERFSLNMEIKQKNTELSNALAEIKELDRMKTEFMVLINHELKTPLTNIINFSSLLVESSLNNEQKLFTEKIINSSNKLRKIVEDCLLMIKALSHQLKPQNQSYPIKDLSLYIDTDTQSLIRKKSLQLLLQIQEMSWSTDPLLLGEVLKRLLNNAAKYSNESGTIDVQLFKMGPHEVLRIHNSGHPFDETKKEKLFQPFFIDENIMNHSQGLGLGLAVSKAVCDVLEIMLDIRNTDNGVAVTLSKKM